MLVFSFFPVFFKSSLCQSFYSLVLLIKGQDITMHGSFQDFMSFREYIARRETFAAALTFLDIFCSCCLMLDFNTLPATKLVDTEPKK